MTGMVASSEHSEQSEQALTVLRADHRRIKLLLAHLKTCKPLEQQKVLADLFLGLRVHSVVEQQVVYPSIGKSSLDSERIADCRLDLYTMLSMMLALEAAGEGQEFVETLSQLAKKFEQHVGEDERIFSQLGGQSENKLCLLADKMVLARKELETKLAPRKVTEEAYNPMRSHTRACRCA